MDDNLLMKISLTTAIFGILILFFISENIAYASDINTADAGSKVIIKGRVVAVDVYNNSQIISILPYTKTRIIMFDKKDINIDDSIEVIGQVDDYKGQKEIIAEEIRKI